MKYKLVLIFFVTFVLFANTPSHIFVFAQSDKTIFARIETNNVFIYSSPQVDDSVKLFEIPITYFVQLVGNAGDKDNLFYYAKYMDVNGYVKKDEVVPIAETPQTPYANNLSFRVFSPSGLDLKSSPNNQTPFNRITSVPYLATNLVYYGCVHGEEMIPQKSDIWFYCKYIENNSSYFGYLYSDLCDMLPNISTNTEVVTKLDGEIFVSYDTEETSEVNTPNVSVPLKAGIIVLVCLPCFLLIYLLFKPTKLITNKNKDNKHKFKRLKRAEYYELDD